MKPWKLSLGDAIFVLVLMLAMNVADWIEQYRRWKETRE
jgi:hypothetical protein